MDPVHAAFACPTRLQIMAQANVKVYLQATNDLRAMGILDERTTIPNPREHSKL